MNDLSIPAGKPGYQLRFTHLYDRGRGYAFPCDATGRVELASLSENGRDRYLHAQACVGTEFSAPIVAQAE